MTDSDHNLDSRLRDVSLPAGLVARLRNVVDGSGEISDGDLDRELRDVAVPVGLTSRLQAVIREPAKLTVDVLDHELQQVAIPDGLVDRVRDTVADAALDEQLAGLEPPARVLSRLRVIPHLRPHSRWQQALIAASLVLVLAGLQVAGLVQIVGSLQPAQAELAEIWVDELSGEMIDDGPLNLVARTTVILPLETPAEPDIVSSFAEPRLAVPSVELAAVDVPAVDGPADELWVTLRERGRLWDDVLHLTWGALGAPVATRELPELEPGPQAGAFGIELPLVPGVDRRFLYRYAIHPPIFPGRHAALRTATIPLATRTTSFERAGRTLAEGRRPRPEDVRIEDFLAAMPYGFALPEGRSVGLRTAAGPSRFGEPNAHLLQVGVQAGQTSRRQRAATHLAIAIDVSESMRWGARMERVRQALRELLDRLAAGDRVSLVVFNERIKQLVEFAGPDDRPELLNAIEGLRAGGGTNLGLGVREALGVALEPLFSAALPARLVLITDGRAELAEGSQQQLRQRLEQAAQRGVTTEVLSVSPLDAADPQLQQLAKAGGGQVVQVQAADEIRWALVESLTGSSTVMVEDAELRVTFNPAVVAAYRLIGHDATPLAAIEPVTVRTGLRSGQAATALLEVWLRAGDADDVGWAELSWRDPASGNRSQIRQRISRLQFAPSFRETALSLQAAMVAAETAEVFRGGRAFRLTSPVAFAHQPKRADLRHVLAAVDEVNEGLGRRAAFRRFVQLIEQWERTPGR